MNKKNLSAAIAGVGILGAFGYRVYSQYRLLKTDDKTSVEDTEVESVKVDLDESAVTEDEHKEFEFESLFQDVTVKDDAVETNENTDVDNVVKIQIEKQDNEDVKDESEPKGDDEKKNLTTENKDTVLVEHDLVDVSENNTSIDYVNMDVNDPKYWSEFEKEINNK